MKETGAEDSRTQEDDVHTLCITCYRCGKEGHKASDCRYKNTKCHICLKTGHLAKVCRSSSYKATGKKGSHGKGKVNKQGNIQAVDNDSTEPSSDEQLHGIFQVGGKSPKFMVIVAVNGVPIKMEVDTGAERSTIPAALFEDKLATVCKVLPSQVTLQQFRLPLNLCKVLDRL